MYQPAFVNAVLSIVGIVLTALAVIATRRTRKFMRIAVETGAVVSELVKKDGWSTSGYKDTYAPAFCFDAQGGQSWRVVSKFSTSWRSYKVGDKIRVLYDPSQPTEARIRTLMGVWSAPIMMGGMGVAFLAFSLYGSFTSQP